MVHYVGFPPCFYATNSLTMTGKLSLVMSYVQYMSWYFQSTEWQLSRTTMSAKVEQSIPILMKIVETKLN